jgi:hypothetical protein
MPDSSGVQEGKSRTYIIAESNAWGQVFTASHVDDVPSRARKARSGLTRLECRVARLCAGCRQYAPHAVHRSIRLSTDVQPRKFAAYVEHDIRQSLNDNRLGPPFEATSIQVCGELAIASLSEQRCTAGKSLNRASYQMHNRACHEIVTQFAHDRPLKRGRFQVKGYPW